MSPANRRPQDPVSPCPAQGVGELGAGSPNPADGLSDPHLPSEVKRSAPLDLPRFSMRSLMSAVTLLALFCLAVLVLPSFISQILVGAIWIAVAGWLITGVFFAKGEPQAFCLSAAIVFVSMWTGFGAHFMEGTTRLCVSLFGAWIAIGQAALWLDLTGMLLASLVNGWLAIRAYHYFKSLD